MTAFTITREDAVAFLVLDAPGEPVNTLSTAVFQELAGILFDQLEADPSVRAVVLISGKPENFVAGADINEFSQIESAEHGAALCREGQALINRVAAYSKPIVAAIHGACLGGGLELSLACDWRIATDHPKTQLGLPEIQIGILPALGGCQRLPRLIGLQAALDIILAGRSERATKAFRLGMVDELVHPAILRETAARAALRLAERTPHRKPGGSLLLDRNPLGRAVVYRQARAKVLERTKGHYPAPLAAIEAIRTGLEHGIEAGLRMEAQKFGELAVSEVARNLTHIFFATTALKKDDGVPAGTAARNVRRLGVVGSGFMGAAIAGTAVAQAEVEVRLKDADLPRVGKGIKAAIGVLDGQLKRRRISRLEYQRLSALVSGGADFRGFARADLVIEAVFEDLSVKQQVLAEVELVIGREAVFATNTSTIPIGRIGVGARHPERVLGMHFFSPVDRMPLLEVIPGERTAPEAVATAVRFGRRMGKTVIVVADSPGFWVNRILSPYMNEAGVLLEEGVPVEVIDQAMTEFGFPVGPVTLLDEVGLDVAQKAGGVMLESFGERLQPSGVVPKLVADGRLGRKNGRGFYEYGKGKKGRVDETVYRVIGVEPLAGADKSAAQRRLVYIMLNEAARAVAEGVVRRARDGDIGAVMGFGFPPFRGGPLRMIDTLGPDTVVRTLQDLERDYGERFTPAEALVEMARAGERFYEDQ
jgi:3-hydroxyacyl-CoA dehydrogenase / enoyl-CoA hydratase / 3-hydroxybutyryl-CoA epimerase